MSEGKTFREAYATLQKHAQTLRSQQEPDIDNLTTIVSESVEAYKVCKQRIDAVEKALEQALGNAQIESPAEAGDQPVGGGSRSSGPRGGSDDRDDEIPF
jgi:exodeoxyribonuclease VII small subunit